MLVGYGGGSWPPLWGSSWALRGPNPKAIATWVRRCHVPLLPSLSFAAAACLHYATTSIPACWGLLPVWIQLLGIPAPSLPAGEWQRGPAAPWLLQDCPAPPGLPSLPSPLPPLPNASHAPSKAGQLTHRGHRMPDKSAASFPFPIVPPLELGWNSQCIQADQKPPHESVLSTFRCVPRWTPSETSPGSPWVSWEDLDLQQIVIEKCLSSNFAPLWDVWSGTQMGAVISTG